MIPEAPKDTFRGHALAAPVSRRCPYGRMHAATPPGLRGQQAARRKASRMSLRASGGRPSLEGRLRGGK
eukprot:365053-Chlamydomonas_euryale.AAC.28